MEVKFSGSVHYANGDPISNADVGVFDRDAHGKADDDITVTAGLSDETGRFYLTYEPLRYLDFHTIYLPDKNDQTSEAQAGGRLIRMPDLRDLYLPYLKFNLTINGVNQEYSASLGVLQTEFHLPVNPAVDFLPSRDGFKFPNSFSGYFLPYSTPPFLNSRKISSKYGLCGGMCAGVYDFRLADRTIPQALDVPKPGTRLQRFLLRRQIDSFGGLGQQAVKVAQWTSLPDDTLVGTLRRTADEFGHIRLKLDQGNLVILALIYERARSVKELSRRIFNNHQVLAWAYQEDASGAITIHIYDPNLPGRDDVVVRSEQVLLSDEVSPSDPQSMQGLKSSELLGGEFYKLVRGFFEIPYSPVKLPKGI